MMIIYKFLNFNYIKIFIFFLDEEEYVVNLIDSPGHVDFSSEASK